MVDLDKLKPMVKLTVADLLEVRDDGTGYGCELFKNRMIAKDGSTGKILFDTRNNKKAYVEKFFDRQIIAMWVEMREIWKPSGFMASYEAVLCCYIHHIDEKVVPEDG